MKNQQPTKLWSKFGSSEYPLVNVPKHRLSQCVVDYFCHSHTRLYSGTQYFLLIIPPTEDSEVTQQPPGWFHEALWVFLHFCPDPFKLPKKWYFFPTAALVAAALDTPAVYLFHSTVKRSSCEFWYCSLYWLKHPWLPSSLFLTHWFMRFFRMDSLCCLFSILPACCRVTLPSCSPALPSFSPPPISSLRALVSSRLFFVIRVCFSHLLPCLFGLPSSYSWHMLIIIQIFIWLLVISFSSLRFCCLLVPAPLIPCDLLCNRRIPEALNFLELYQWRQFFF